MKKNNLRNTLKFKLKKKIAVAAIALLGVVFVAGVGLVVYKTAFMKAQDDIGKPVADEDNPIPKPKLDVELLDYNEYSRPGYQIERITGIVIHYTANPGSTAMNNRDYFNNLKDTHTTYASSHFIVGLDGEIVQCIPTKEYSYASNERNKDTISIETCYINEDGSFEKKTYESLVNLTAWLTVKFGLKPKHIIRHYDVTGKNCPKYFVEHEEAWEKFKKDVQEYIDRYGL